MYDFEEYFKYRWDNCKNDLFSAEYEDIWHQLPDQTLDDVKINIVYFTVYSKCAHLFAIPKETENLHARYTLFDQEYL